MASGGGMSMNSNQQQQNKEQMDRSARSVFVGNIPYEATEDKLKEIFSQAGPVLSFRLVYDRESGKPKGYGFCEYKDQETAQSAMRNLNSTELHGRQLRVDSASSEKGKDEKGAEPVKTEVSPYGPDVHPSKAPAVITEAVASLPPEQMFDLMKQMKLCIQSNPEEARQMLLQNPQLAFALLQAQVVMKIVDPKVAQAILHQPRGDPLPIGQLLGQPGVPPPSLPPPGHLDKEMKGMMPPDMRGPPPMEPPMSRDNWRPPGDQMPPRDRREMGPPPNMHPSEYFGKPPDGRGGEPIEIRDPRDFRNPMEREEPREIRRGPPPDREYRDPRDDRFRGEAGGGPPFDPRDRGTPMDPRDRQMPMMDPRDPRARMDLRGPPDHMRGPPPSLDNRGPPRPTGPPLEQRGPPPDMRGPRDDRMIRGQPQPPDPRDPRGHPLDPREMRAPPVSRADTRDPRGGPPDPRGGPPDPRGGPPDPRGGPPDPRFRPGGPGVPPPGVLPITRPGQGPIPVPGPGMSPQTNFLDQRKLGAVGAPEGPRDEDKAKLIMQVLSLTDEQIAMLPEEQKRSIMLLKDQIARSKP